MDRDDGFLPSTWNPWATCAYLSGTSTCIIIIIPWKTGIPKTAACGLSANQGSVVPRRRFQDSAFRARLCGESGCAEICPALERNCDVVVFWRGDTMWYGRQWGRINIQFVLVLILAAAGVGVSLVVARQFNTSARSEQARNDGETAYTNRDWPTAVNSYREYLGRNPDDLAILHKYAQACLSVRPLDVAAINEATSAYRRITELDPQDELACERLALIYERVQNFSGLVSFARARLERDPNDRSAPLWLANALDKLERPEEARQVLQDLHRPSRGPPLKVHPEYTQACIQMSGLVARETTVQPHARPTGRMRTTRRSRPLWTGSTGQSPTHRTLSRYSSAGRNSCVAWLRRPDPTSGIDRRC